MKAQSAMEYLMTYGWAILIIAIVLAALFQLGVFNSTNFAPKAPPGSCQVFRPDGPGSTQFISTEGLCNGELPQYVASFNGIGLISLPNNSMPVGSQPMTVSGWFLYTSTSPNPAMFWSYGVSGNCGAGNYFSLRYNIGDGNPNPTFTTDPWCDQVATSLTSQANIWYFVTETNNVSGQWIYAGYGGKIYSNNGGVSANIISGPFYIGHGNDGSNFIGLASNLQIYNTTLTANEIQALYQEGIGGAPIDLQNLVGWWPLNGNANDYSGNGYNGNAINVAYTGSWTNGYTSP